MFTIDIDKFSKKLGDKMPLALDKEIRLSMKESLEDIQQYSSSNHRYITRSGMADKAYYKRFGKKSLLYQAMVGLSKTISNAPYIIALNSGRKDWPNYKPEGFFGTAVNMMKGKIIKRLNGIVRRARKGIL